jgi:hypothetical protein
MIDQQNTNKYINLTIRFDEQSVEDLEVLAREKGIGKTTLARMWVLERLHQEKRDH